MGGGGGMRTSSNRDQISNVWIIRYATSEGIRGRVFNLEIIKLKSGNY